MARKRHRSSLPSTLRVRTLVGLGCTIFAGFLIASTVSFLIFRGTIRDSILRSELPLSSDNIYSEIQRDLFQPILISSLMASDTFLKDWILAGEIDHEPIRRYLSGIQQEYDTISAFFVSASTLNYYHPTAPLRKVDPEDPLDVWFFRVAQMQQPYEINIDPDQMNRDTMTIFINYRVVNGEGRFLGVTGVGLGVGAVKDLMQEYRERYDREVYFYDRDGNLVMHRLAEEEDGAMQLPAAFGFQEEVAEVLARVRGGDQDASLSATGLDGSLANLRFIPELDWVLVVEQLSDGTRPALLRTFTLNLLVCLITTGILLAFVRRTSLRYARRLEARNLRLARQNARIEAQREQLADANRHLETLRVEAESASSAKSAFIANMSHEIRTPMNAIIGFAEVLEDGLSDDEQREQAAIIASSGRSLLALVNDILDLSKIEAGRLEANTTPVDLTRLIRESVAILAHLAREKGLTMVFEPPATPLPSPLLLDEIKVRQILYNLIGNAIKFTPEGGVTLRATCQPRPEDPSRFAVTIEVIDTGMGIAEDAKERIFETFEQAAHTSGGTGLGLSICRRLAHLLGGTITVTNNPRCRGSIFTLRLDDVAST